MNYSDVSLFLIQKEANRIQQNFHVKLLLT